MDIYAKYDVMVSTFVPVTCTCIHVHTCKWEAWAVREWNSFVGLLTVSQ